MSGNERNDQPEQPRQPHNLQGLLKFAMEGKKNDENLFKSQKLINFAIHSN